MRGHVLEVLVPGLREARRSDDARETVAVQRIVATRDPLTGLLNERACAAVGQSVHSWAVRHHEPVGVVVLRVERPVLQDALALEIANVVKGLLGDGDVGARIAVDEFVVLLADADEDRVWRFVAELGNGLAYGVLAGAPSESGWCSVGVATAPADASEDYEALLERARNAADPAGSRRGSTRGGVAARFSQRLALAPFVRGPLEAVRKLHRN